MPNGFYKLGAALGGAGGSDPTMGLEAQNIASRMAQSMYEAKKAREQDQYRNQFVRDYLLQHANDPNAQLAVSAIMSGVGGQFHDTAQALGQQMQNTERGQTFNYAQEPNRNERQLADMASVMAGKNIQPMIQAKQNTLFDQFAPTPADSNAIPTPLAPSVISKNLATKANTGLTPDEKAIIAIKNQKLNPDYYKNRGLNTLNDIMKYTFDPAYAAKIDDNLQGLYQRTHSTNHFGPDPTFKEWKQGLTMAKVKNWENAGKLNKREAAYLTQVISGAGKSQGRPAGLPQDARQAPDGNWYVQRNGKYYRVEPQ